MEDLSVPFLLTALLPRLPLFLVWAVAAVFAVARWERHPMVSALVVGAGAVSVLLSVGTMLLPVVARREGVSASGMGVVYGLVGLVNSGALAVLLFAAFAGRDGSRPPPSA